jgi:hypothetical protein
MYIAFTIRDVNTLDTYVKLQKLSFSKLWIGVIRNINFPADLFNLFEGVHLFLNIISVKVSD